MKRIIALTAALAVFFAMTSCSSKSGSSALNDGTSGAGSPSQVTATSDTSQGGFYRYEKIDLPADVYWVSQIFPIGDSEIGIKYLQKNMDDEIMYRTDKQFGMYTFMEYDYPEAASSYDWVYGSEIFAPDASFVVLLTLEDHGGVPFPENSTEPDAWENFRQNLVSKEYLLCSYDKDGVLLNSTPLEFPDELIDYDYPAIHSCVAEHGDLIAVFTDGTVRRISGTDGSITTLYTFEIEDDHYDSGPILLRDRDNKLMVRLTDVNMKSGDNGIEYNDSVMCSYYDFTDCKLSDAPLCTFPEHEAYAGYDKYRLICILDDGLYGVCDDGTQELIIDWFTSGITAPHYVLPLGNDEFVAILESGGETNELVKLVPRDPSEISDVEYITVGAFFDPSMSQIVSSFNNYSEHYRVNCVTYFDSTDFEGEYSDALDAAKDQLTMDLITGNAPDVFLDMDYRQYLNLMQKGAFADLGRFMDSDPDHSRDKFVPGVINAMTAPDGGIYAIPTQFSCTSLTVKTKFWDKPTWTLDEMIGFYDNAPSTAIHMYDTISKSHMLNNMLYAMEDLIDYPNGKCYFDSPEFIELLKFCDRFVEDESPDLDKDKIDEYYTDMGTWFGRDLQLVATGGTSPFGYCEIKYFMGNGEDIQLVGYPSNSGNGGRIAPFFLLSISSSCQNKQAAWEFLTYYLEEVGKNANGSGFCSLKDKFENYMYSEVGVEHTASGNPIQPITKEEVDMLIDYVYSCTGVENAFDKDLWAIIEEESEEYFAGRTTAEDAAAMIQNRAGILVAEKM
ncbi:MAG: extracellular solute-binding protein [Ruminococcus sp.]|nr:extracellular solute-binding protein [Ruminococcus sp.]